MDFQAIIKIPLPPFTKRGEQKNRYLGRIYTMKYYLSQMLPRISFEIWRLWPKGTVSFSGRFR